MNIGVGFSTTPPNPAAFAVYVEVNAARYWLGFCRPWRSSEVKPGAHWRYVWLWDAREPRQGSAAGGCLRWLVN